MCICSFSTFFLNTSKWLLPTITVIFSLHYSRWNMSNHMLSKGGKKERKNWSTLMSRDLQSWRSSFSPFKNIYYFRFLIFEIIRFVVWFYVLSAIFPSSVNFFNFCFANLFLLKFLFSRIYSVILVLWIFSNWVTCNILQSFNVCPKSGSQFLVSYCVKIYSLSIYFRNLFFRLESDLSRFIYLYRNF